MQKIITLPPENEIMEYFPYHPAYRYDIPYLPDDVITEGTWANEDITERQRFTKKIIPALLFFKNGNVLMAAEKRYVYRIWFGDPITPEDLAQYRYSYDLVRRTVKKEWARKETVYDYIGYCTWRQGWIRDAFLIVYAANVETKRLLKNEFWAQPHIVPQFYSQLEPLSKKLFDVFYETPELFRKYMSV